MMLERTAVSGDSVEPSRFGAAQIVSPALRDLHQYWRRKWQGRRMPCRADIEPLEIPALLPMVFLVDIEREPLRFRFRLVGTRVVTWFGRDATGEYLAEPFVLHYRQVMETRQPAYDRLEAPGRNGRRSYCQRLLLPLAGEDGEVAMLLGGIHPSPVLI